jgi:exonuclease III
LSRTACYVRSDITYYIRKYAGTKILAVSVEDFLFVGVYRPFKVEVDSTLMLQFDKIIRQLENIMDSVVDPKTKIIVAGDFNLDFQKIGPF